MISKQQKLHLKKMSHTLKPVVMIGQNGLTNNVLDEISSTIEKHEVIKIKISQADKASSKLIIEKLLGITKATLINHIGHVIVIYKRNNEKPVISFPS
ncbi:MAG: ribosome assembly RNA-binding protein YhbY [Methylococcales bacterium]|jgi:RNA-binding protein|nr:ribosome assembly RNA-binding protein YhbY [Methylococcales bacterium]MBT7410830.1 ribosome assembly RNA-binding protein YhbY [Methylococcales bacterium]